MAVTPPQFTNIEHEVIYLKATYDMINSMVNRVNIELYGSGEAREVQFATSLHQEYFNIILVDFLSPSDINVVGKHVSYRDALTSIAENPEFSINNSENSLKEAIKEFNDWLDTEIEVEKLWLPSINTELNMKLKRYEFIKICGNISKHNFSRLSVVGNQLVKILERNGKTVDMHEALSILDEFHENFHDNVLNYHGTRISELLNNIRLGIYEYLKPEHDKSITWCAPEPGYPRRYEYTYPQAVTSKFAKTRYWDLMNDIMNPPYMEKFKTPDILKKRY